MNFIVSFMIIIIVVLNRRNNKIWNIYFGFNYIISIEMFIMFMKVQYDRSISIYDTFSLIPNKLL